MLLSSQHLRNCLKKSKKTEQIVTFCIFYKHFVCFIIKIQLVLFSIQKYFDSLIEECVAVVSCKMD